MSIIFILSKAVSILLKDVKSTEKMCCESWIYALQYIKLTGSISDEKYTYAVEYLFNMLPKDCNMTFEEFGKYFEQRCRLYEELHCKVAKNENPPLAWGIIQHLIYTFPLQTVQREIVGPYALTHTGFFDNMNFIENSLSMFSFLHEALYNNAQQIEDEEDTIEGLDNGEYNNYDDYDDADAAQVIAKQLVQKYGKEKAICIVETILEQSLIAYDESPDSQGVWSCIDKSCRILDVLQPIESECWSSHCQSDEQLAEFLTIDFARINSTSTLLRDLSRKAKLRANGLKIVMTGPPIKIKADKFNALSQMYDDTHSLFLLWKSELGCAALEKKIWRDLTPGNPISSQSYLIDGYVLGFIFNGKVYINKEFPINIDKAYIHLYTYLWMEYCKKDNFILYQVLINLAKQTNHFHHIRCSKRFLDINEEEAAIKALCYIVAFDGGDIFLDEKRKVQLMSSELAEYKTFDLPRMIDLTIEEAKRLPLISFIRGDKISNKDICGEIKFYNSKQ